jgi:hypothetical protein
MKLLCAMSLLLVSELRAQPVSVTAQLETNRVQVGASTTLHVFAQIAPEFRGGSARIFSWNVDAISSGPQFDIANLRRPTSDNDPQTSSSGTPDGLNLRSIRDSFLNITNAGRDTMIELFSVPLLALSPGLGTIAIQAGTLADEPDFVVEPVGDGPTLTGGDYRQAQVQLEIIAPLTNFVTSISRTPLPENEGLLITVAFPISAGYSYSVEYATNLSTVPSWLTLPNAPHNVGFADDTNTVPLRFYRIRALRQ